MGARARSRRGDVSVGQQLPLLRAEREIRRHGTRDSLYRISREARRAEDFAIKVSDPFSRAALHEKFDIGNPECHVAVFLARRVAAEVVAPRTRRRDVIAIARPFEVRALQALYDGLEPLFEMFRIRDDEARVTREALRAARRQVKLLLADVDPHVVEADGEIRIAREAEADDVEENRLRLI